MGGLHQIVAAGGEHLAPRGVRGLDAQPQEREPRFGEEHARGSSRGLHGQHARRVRHEVPEDGPGRAGARSPCGQDEVALLKGEGHGPRHPRVPHPGGGGEGQDEGPEPSAHIGQDGDGQEDAGHGQEHVHGPAEQGVRGASEIAREGPREEPGAQGQAEAEADHHQGDPPAVKQSREHIAPQVVRPQPVRRGGALQPRGEIQLGVGGRGQHGRQ